jgi:hypothetical protein
LSTSSNLLPRLFEAPMIQDNRHALSFGVWQRYIHNIAFKADWERIQKRKQGIINMSNRKENKSRIPHEYKVGDTRNTSEALITLYGTISSNTGV